MKNLKGTILVFMVGASFTVVAQQKDMHAIALHEAMVTDQQSDVTATTAAQEAVAQGAENVIPVPATSTPEASPAPTEKIHPENANQHFMTEQNMVPYTTEQQPAETQKTPQPETKQTQAVAVVQEGQAQPLVVPEIPQPPIMKNPEESKLQPPKKPSIEQYNEAFKRINELVDQINEIILKLK